MPKFGDPDQAAINAETENGGVTEETKRKRGREKKFFNDLLIAHYGGKPLDEIVKTLDKQALILLLNDALRGYFQTMLVQNRTMNENGEEIVEELSPKRNTAECSKSHLKKIILDEAKLDISGPEFAIFNVSICYEF